MKQIKLFEEHTACSGCGACLAVCPREAISMSTGALGALYPQIDEAKCIHCGKCMDVCAFQAPKVGHKPLKAYAAVGQCDEVVKNSASGGVFASVAGACLKENACVAGAVMTWSDGQADVKHILASDEESISQLQGSKYVQSRAWNSYQDVLQAVKRGSLVLFSGTPCQVAAIRKLTGDAENLVTMDLICHGVPSLNLLNEAAAILEKRLGGKVEHLVFRDKTTEKQFCARVDTCRKQTRNRWYLRARLFPFYQLFLEGNIYRDSCYCCPYANLERISDITVGDYWGIQQFHGEQIARGEMPDRKDWSCILVNTEKGQKFLEQYGNTLCLYESRPEWVAAQNGQLNQPSRFTPERQELMTCYCCGGYAAVESWYIRKNGGRLRFLWRMYKSLYKNKVTGEHK